VDRVDQRGERRRTCDDVVVGALAVPPAVVAAGPPAGLVVDLLPLVLANVGGDHRAGAPAGRIVERIAPRVTPAEAPDLRPSAAANKRIVRRNCVTDRMGVRHADVDPKHLAEERPWILGEVIGIVS
jgi:hypothetical protein